MERFILQVRALAPRQAAVSGLEETAGLIVTMCADIQNLRVTRIDDDVIDEHARLTEVIKELPVLAAVGRRVNLAAKRAEVEAVWIVGIDYKSANVTSLWAGGAPVVRIQSGI